MIKNLLRMTLGLLLGLLGLVVAVTVGLGPGAKAAVESGSTYALGVPASLAEAHARLGLSTCGLTLQQLRIENPEGIAGGPFLEVGELSTRVRNASLMSDTVQLETLRLDGLHLRLVQDGPRNNALELIEHVRRRLAASGEDHDAPAEEEEQGTAVAVQKVEVQGVQVSVSLMGIPGLRLDETYPVPAFQLEFEQPRPDGGSGGRLSDLVGVLVESLYTHALAAADEHLPDEAVALLAGDLDDLQDRLLDEAGERLQRGLDELLGGQERPSSEEVEGELKKLFGGR